MGHEVDPRSQDFRRLLQEGFLRQVARTRYRDACVWSAGRILAATKAAQREHWDEILVTDIYAPDWPVAFFDGLADYLRTVVQVARPTADVRWYRGNRNRTLRLVRRG